MSATPKHQASRGPEQDTSLACTIRGEQWVATRIKATVRSSQGTEEELSLRVFLPDENQAFARVCDEALARLEARVLAAKGRDRAFYTEMFLMLRFHHDCPPLETKHERSFTAETLRYSEGFRALLERYQLAGSDPGEQLVAIADDLETPAAKLLRAAIYERPECRLPLAHHEEYMSFRRGILIEFDECLQEFDRIRREMAASARAKLLADAPLSTADRRRRLDRVATLERGDDPALAEALRKITGQIITKSMERASREATAFADLVERAGTLLGTLSDPWTSMCDRTKAGHGARIPIGEFEAMLQAHLDVPAADALLKDAVERCERVWGADDSLPEGHRCADRPEYHRLKVDLAGRDLVRKFEALNWVVRHFYDPAECFRLLRRETESVEMGLHQEVFKHLYRTVRRQMNRFERRAFMLLFFRQKFLGGRVAIREPVIQSFLTGTGSMNLGLVLLTLVFKHTSWGGEQGLGAELEQRWKAYLRVYPAWLAIIQGEERADKADERAESMTVRLDEDTKDREGKPTSRHTLMADPRAGARPERADLPAAVDLKPEDLIRLGCTSKEADAFIHHERDGLTQQEIAASTGVSQQAVGKLLTKARQKLREALAPIA